VIAMPRTLWLALVGLLVVSALFALRTSTGARAIAGRTDAAPPAAIEDDGLPLAKSDRLPSLALNRAESKASVTTVKIAPDPPETKASSRTVEAHRAGREREEITGWHWHAGSKTIRRTTSQPKSARGR
jgi:hypothetical protein